MSVFRLPMNSDDERGHCMSCRWWQAENEDAEVASGLCMQPEMTHFSIQLTAHSGCNRFEAAMVEDLVGAMNSI